MAGLCAYLVVFKGLDCAGLQTEVRLTGGQAAHLAEIHESLMERCSVDTSDVDSSKWEEILEQLPSW